MRSQRAKSTPSELTRGREKKDQALRREGDVLGDEGSRLGRRILIDGLGLAYRYRSLGSPPIDFRRRFQKSCQKGLILVQTLTQCADMRTMLDTSLRIAGALMCWVNGANFDFEDSRQIDRTNAGALWKQCTFDIKR
jgi:hypothetical protein